MLRVSSIATVLLHISPDFHAIIQLKLRLMSLAARDERIQETHFISFALISVKLKDPVLGKLTEKLAD